MTSEPPQLWLLLVIVEGYNLYCQRMARAQRGVSTDGTVYE